MANKIKYGLSNVYYAVATEADDGTMTYGTPVRWMGAVNMTATASGEETILHADNIPYFKLVSNNGYTGTFESALVPDSFKEDVLGEIVGGNGIRYENADVLPKPFAFMFQFEGDETATRHVFYNCTASRPDVSGATKETSITPQTQTINFTALPRKNDHITKGDLSDATSEVYTNWFIAVQNPTASNTEPAGE